MSKSKMNNITKSAIFSHACSYTTLFILKAIIGSYYATLLRIVAFNFRT